MRMTTAIKAGIWALLVSASLVACSGLPSFLGQASGGAPTAAVQRGAAPGAVVPASLVEGAASGAQAGTDPTAVRGHVDFPAPRTLRIQAASNYAAAGATLTLIDTSTGFTVVTGYTDNAGNFYLPLNGFTPLANSYFLLEATHGLASDAAGSQVARFRTFLEWTGSAWTSTSGSTIVLNPQTTAMAVVSSLDPANVPASSTMGTVSGSTVSSSPNAGKYSVTYINNLATAIASYLTNNDDPIESSSALTPTITGLDPAAPAAGGAMLIVGAGFSPVLAGDTVLLGTATASVFSATGNTLGVFVPAGAPSSGNVTVSTTLGTSAGVAYSLAGSGGGAGGLSLSAISPTSGAPGDTIMIRGTGFPSATASVAVSFNGATASVTYADSSTILATVPAAGGSGPLTVTVAGATVGYYFAYIVPSIASFSPLVGNQNNQVTVQGQNFGLQGTYSKLVFDGVSSPNIVTWYNTQVVGVVPAPSLTNKISGPITVVTGFGLLSPNGGTFTASQSLDENFSTTNVEDSSSTAAWGSGTLTPASAATTFSQSGTAFSGNTNSTGLIAASAGLQLLGGTMPHTGNVATYGSFGQLGVDGSSFFVSVGAGNSPTIYRYSLGNDSLLGSSSNTSVDVLIYDPSNNRYLGADYYNGGAISGILTAWNTGYSSTVANYTPMLAANGGPYYLVQIDGGTSNLLGTGVGSTLLGAYGALSNIVTYGLDGAAGIIGDPTFFYSGATGALSSLLTLTATNVAGTTALPFTINPPTGGAGMCQIGSDGTYLYMLGNNASYNGGANTLFRFAVSGATITGIAGSPTNSPFTSVTASISLPAHSIWDTVTYSDTVPAGTTLTVDVLNGATGTVLMSNVSSGTSLNSLSAASLKLRATLQTSSGTVTPVLASWAVTTRGAYALSKAYDTQTNFATYLPAVVASNSASITMQYSDSADGTTWGSWASSPTALSRRYIRYNVNFGASNAAITNILLPYDY